MPNNSKKYGFKALAGDKDTLSKFLAALSEMARADPNIKGAVDEFKEFLSLFAQNPDGFATFFTRLSELAEGHPGTGGMTLDEFIEAYPGTLEAAAGTIMPGLNGNRLKAAGLEAGTLAHITLPTTALTNLLKQFLNNPKRLESPRRDRIAIEEHYFTKDTVITYKGEGAEYTVSIERVKELFAKRVQNGAKIFNFLLQKLNEQNYQEKTKFRLSELVDAGIYANLDSAYRGLKTVTDKLMRIHVEGKATAYQGRKRKEVLNTKAAIVAYRAVTYNECVVSLPPIIRDSAPAITILPRWGYSLQNENAYILLDYTYYLARQNTDKIRERGCFNIKLESVRCHIGLPPPEEVKENNKGNYNILIVKPIEDAITAIEDRQQGEGDELKITPVYNADYKNIYEYLDGYLEIRLSGAASEYMEQRAIKEESKKAAARRLEAKKGGKGKGKPKAGEAGGKEPAEK